MLMQQNEFSFIVIVIVIVEYFSECNGNRSIPPPYNNLTRFRRQSIANVTPVLPVNGECLPPVFKNGKYIILGTDNYFPGNPIPNYSFLNFTCNNNNDVLTTNNVVYCINGKFSSKMPKCVASCSAIFSTSIDVKCELNDVEQDCSKNVPEGTIATMKCKTHYEEIHRGPSTAICSGASWDVPIKHCSPECGELVPKGQPLIVSGTTTKKGEFPWHVAIYKERSKDFLSYICGGSIISVKLVVSVAQCFTDNSNGKLHPISKFSVAAGKYFSDWDAPEDADFVQKRKISKIEIPEDIYLGHEYNYAADIAVVVVIEPFVLTNLVKPVCVDWNSDFVETQLKSGAFGQVAGWGSNTPGHFKASVDLKQLTVPFIDLGQCLKIVPKDFRVYLTADKYCAGYTNGSSVCNGDLGGGMVFPQGEYNRKKFYIQGVASIGPQEDGACDDHQVAIYTKLQFYISFIKKVEASNRIIDLRTQHPAHIGCFVCNNRKDCVPYSAECDGKYDCSDNSDEINCDNKLPEECLPPTIQNGNYRVLTSNEYRSRKPIPNFSIVEITCINDNYVLSTPYSTVSCLQGNYSHEIPKCLLFCIPIFPTSIDVDCKFDGMTQDCTKQVREGTIAYMKCKPNYVDKNPEITKTTCTSNGLWDSHPKQCSSPYMCPPRLSTAIDVYCELNGVAQDCNKEVPDGTVSRMRCKKNYKDVKNGPSIAYCSNGAWTTPPKNCIPDCDQIVSEGQTHIINGGVTNRGDFPWHIALYRQKPQEPLEYKCGGSIISVKVVISAAHCLTDANNGNIYPVTEYLVAAGKKYSKWDAPEDEYFVQKRNIIKIYTPRNVYFGQVSSYAGDIAVLVVDKLFIFSNFVSPVCVDWYSENVNQQLTHGSLGNVAGWGSTSTGNPIASVTLKQLTIPYVGRDQCVEIVPKHFLSYVTVDKYCAGYTNGSSVCGGDSGGGMVFPRLTIYGVKKYYLQGIISVGPSKDSQCDDFQLGVYTSVNNYVTFIRDIEESNRI